MKKGLLFILLPFLLFACKEETVHTTQTYTIEQFYKNTRIIGGAFSNDEEKILISSDKSGIFNVYEIEIATGEKKQLTFSEKESLFAIDYVPGTEQVLYTADQGGNEINHLFLMQDTANIEDLTPGEKEKARFMGWSKDKQSMYYLSTKRDPRFFDLYKMPVKSKEPEMLYKNEDGLDVTGLSDNEQFLALKKTITNTQDKLYLVDRSTGEMKELSDTAANYSGSGFSNDSKHFYYITNAGEEFAYLASYDIATGEKSILYQTNWDVMYSYLSENEKYRVIAINKDGRNSLKIKETATDKFVSFPDIPDGNVTSVGLSESETKMRLTVGTSKAPSNIYVYNFASKDLKKLTNSLNEAINPEDLVSAEVVRYPSFDGLEIPAIYYKPHIATTDNKVPALVWVHGGPGGQSRIGYFALIQYLVNHGYAVLAVNNRGSSGYGKTFYSLDDRNHGDKDLKDCIWGKKWLQEQPYIDTAQIGIIGGSYGGYMTMAAMTFTPEEFKVGVNIFGVTNWLRTLKSIPPYWESFRKALYKELGNPHTADSVRLRKISPLFHAQNVQNPVMVLQGANDPRVLQIESDEIVAALKENNVPVEYVVFPDEGHGFRKKENQIKGYKQILNFLDTYLKEEPVEE